MSLTFVIKRCIFPSRTAHSVAAVDVHITSAFVSGCGMGTILLMLLLNRRDVRGFSGESATGLLWILFSAAVLSLACLLAYSAILRFTTKLLGFTEACLTFINIVGMSSWVPLALLFPIVLVAYLAAFGYPIGGSPVDTLLRMLTWGASLWGVVILIRTHQAVTGFRLVRSIVAILAASCVFVLPPIAVLWYVLSSV